jgi:integrase
VVAEKLTKTIMADRNGGLVFDAGTITLFEYLDRWLNDLVKDSVRPRTWERYKQNSRIHINPALGRMKLRTLAPAHVRELYRQKLASGLSPRTVSYIHVTLHKALGRGIRRDEIPARADRSASSEVFLPNTSLTSPPAARGDLLRPSLRRAP